MGLASASYVADSTEVLWNSPDRWALLRGTPCVSEHNGALGDGPVGSFGVTPSIHMIAIDFTTGNMWWGSAGSWVRTNHSTADPNTGVSPLFNDVLEPVTFAATADAATNALVFTPFFSAAEFTYAIPTGYKAFDAA